MGGDRLLPEARLERRTAMLRDHLDREYGLDSVSVQLAASGERYTIHVPSKDAIARMFVESSKNPELAKPFWTRVWASGVAMADMALARQSELAGMRVLELGSGLGVTAAAATAAGATVVAADYSDVALSFLRYNTLTNAGASARTLRIDWRTPSPQARDRLEAYHAFPVIMAADVLYEGRDVVPLMQLIDRVLTPDGTLWLAEPGRATAQRFLYRLAEDGWQGVSEEIPVPGEDGSVDTVHVHVLRRPTTSDWLRTSLGGWRI